ncbi:MAG: hypothetical protein V7K48_20120 [Nostoc sp.]|uniref:hypothetical protein n=1 Tax=Nostoc sp. TaxID=1180 RepID=UPI002FFACAC6
MCYRPESDTLFEATSKDEAEAIVADVPLVQHGCVNYQLYEWRIVMEQHTLTEF